MKVLSFVKEDLKNENDKQEPRKIKAMLVCKCWCHDDNDNGAAANLCIKCITRIANGEESLIE